MPLRGVYNRITKESRDRVLRVAENGGDWQACAEAHEIPYRTAYGWLRNGCQPLKKRGGDTRSKLSDEQMEVVLTWLEVNPQLTLKSIAERILQVMDVEISQQSISKRLDGRLFTVKKAHYLPLGVNTVVNKELRSQFVAKTMELTAADKCFIYMDETNFNLFCRKSTGRAVRGRRAVVTLPNSKGPNLHIIGAITSTGILHWERHRGSFKNDTCNAWVRRCLQAAIASGHQAADIVLVIDNAPAHSKIEQVLDEEEFHGGVVLRLAPYSPMLNPIEHVWSAVKAHIKNSMQIHFAELIAGDPMGILTQCEFRLRFLERCADEAMPVISPLMCQRSCNHVQKHYAPALHLQDMPVGQ
jgi:transposase